MEPLLTNPGHNRKASIVKAKVLVPTSVTDTFLASEGRGKPLHIAANVDKNLHGLKVFYHRLKGSTIR